MTFEELQAAEDKSHAARNRGHWEEANIIDALTAEVDRLQIVNELLVEELGELIHAECPNHSQEKMPETWRKAYAAYRAAKEEA